MQSYLTEELKTKIRDFALHSFYRLNAKTADCYAFTLTADGSDWVGGWDWLANLADTQAEYLLMLDSGEIIRR